MNNTTEIKTVDECLSCKNAGKEKVKVYTFWEDMPSMEELAKRFAKGTFEKLRGKKLFFNDQEGKVPHIHAEKAGQSGTAGSYNRERQNWQVTEVMLAASAAEMNNSLKEGWKPYGRTAKECFVFDGRTLYMVLAKFKPQNNEQAGSN